ncbi:unnamed protein product, partial [Didymodactylos carnosus]
MRRESSPDMVFPPSLDDGPRTRLYNDPFDELGGWLFEMLRTGVLISMTEVQNKYMCILRRRNQPSTEAIVRTTAIRARLVTIYGNELHFTTLNKYSGTYVALNNLSVYTRLALSISLNNNESIKTFEKEQDNPSTKTKCESLFDTLKLLRQSINEHYHYFKKLKENPDILANFNSGLFWDCAPLLLKNFIGSLTLSERRFEELQNNYNYYDLLEKDMFKTSSKWLKISSISYDIISCKNDSYVTPKHYLLANELFRHERSSQLLTITNRYGHTCGYKTIVRLHHEAAERVKMSSIPLASVKQQHMFAIKVADNFDLNKESLHGENSIHILNQIIVHNPENDELLTNVHQCLAEMKDIVAESVELHLMPE